MKSNKPVLYRAVPSYSDREAYIPESNLVDSIYYEEHEILKETDSGYWIKRFWSWSAPIKINNKICRFVLKGDGKRYAYPTMHAALNSLHLRTLRRLEILKYQIECSKEIVEHCEKTKEQGNNNVSK